MTKNFPTVDRNHQISTASKHVLDSAHPACWLLESREGPNDFGFDFEVQLAPDGQVQATFRVQLKGTTSPLISSDGKTLSMSLKVRTLNLYAQSGDEVMLVVVAVALQPNGKADLAKSKIYWTWISDELKRLRGNRYLVDLDGDQEEVTLKVPVAQVLTPDTDVLPYLNQRLRVARAMEDLTTLAYTTESPSSGQADPLEQLLINVRGHPELLTFSFDGELDLPQDGIGKLLAEGLGYLRAGRTGLAEDLVQNVDRAKASLSPNLMAELLSLEGKIAMQRHQRAQALALFEQAHATHASERHLLAMAEARFLQAVDEQDEACIDSIAQSLSEVKSDDGLGLLARVHAAAQDAQAAQVAIDRISSRIKQVFAQAVLWSSQRQWSQVRSAVDEAIASGGRAHEIVGLQLLGARAAWNEAMATCARADDSPDLMPLTGLPGLDIHAAQAAWKYSLDGLRGLRGIGWPINIELLAPVAVVAAGALGKQEEALALLREAARERPEYPELQQNLELLAIGAGNPAAALEANLRQPPEHDVLVRRACAYFQATDYPKCVETSLRILGTLESSVPQTPMALALGSAAAARLSRFAERDRLLQALHAEPRYRDFTYLADFAAASLRPGGDSPTPPLEYLRRGLEECPDSKVLTGNLFSNLPVDEPGAAREAIALARRLRQEMAPSAADQNRLITAHLTLHQWQDAEREALAALQRFGRSDRLHAMLAIALEMQGRTAEAVDELERALEHGSNRISPLRNYLGICLRLGRLQAARTTIERLLAVEGDREERLELMRLNALLLLQEGSLDEAVAVIEEVGRVVDKGVETEEGMYLILFSRLMMSTPLEPTVLQVFHERATSFERAWPQSQMFRWRSVTERATHTLDDLHNMLDGLTGGDSRARMREYVDRERVIRSGERPVPFAMRPSYALHYVGDVFTLWQAAKRSAPEDVQLHLSMHRSDEAIPAQVLHDTPLLDLPALLVLHDLGLLSVLLDLFPRVAIPKLTINYVSQHSRGFLVGAEAGAKAAAVLDWINANLARIEQPSCDRSSEKVVTPQKMVRDYLQLASTGRWLVYADDATTRAIATADNPTLKPFCSLALLRVGDAEGVLSEFDVARLLAQLARWNVGISVEHRYLIAALDGAVRDDERMSAHERMERFRQHEPFATLSRALWYPGKSAADLATHSAELVAQALRKPQSNEDSVAAVWALWLTRVRIMLQLDPGLSQDLLPLCLVLVLKTLPVGLEARAVHTALRTVELTLAAGHMSHEEESRFIERLGASFAALAQRGFEAIELLRQRLVAVWPRGTLNAEQFDEAYFSAMRQTAPGEACSR